MRESPMAKPVTAMMLVVLMLTIVVLVMMRKTVGTYWQAVEILSLIHI